MLFRDDCRFPRLALAVALVGTEGALETVADLNQLMEPEDPFVLFVLRLRGTPPAFYLTTRSQQRSLTFSLRRLDSDAPGSLSDHQSPAPPSDNDN